MKQSSMQRSISKSFKRDDSRRMICEQPKPSSNYLCNKPAAPSSQKTVGSTVEGHGFQPCRMVAE